MRRQQWGHGWHTGFESGESFGEKVGHGRAENSFSVVAERLAILARGLQAEANGKPKSAAWWQMYASVMAKQLHDIAEHLPSVLARFSEQPPEDADA